MDKEWERKKAVWAQVRQHSCFQAVKGRVQRHFTFSRGRGDANLTADEEVAIANIVLLHAVVECCDDGPCLGLLLDLNPADVNARHNWDGYTLLHAAADNGPAAHIRTLLTRGANVNARDDEGWTPLMCAAFVGARDCVEVLLGDDSVDIGARNKEGSTVFDIVTEAEKCNNASLPQIRSLLKEEEVRREIDSVARWFDLMHACVWQLQ